VCIASSLIQKGKPEAYYAGLFEFCVHRLYHFMAQADLSNTEAEKWKHSSCVKSRARCFWGSQCGIKKEAHGAKFSNQI